MRTVEIGVTREQREFLYHVLENRDAEHIGYGGARGGNKTFSGALAVTLRRMRYPGTKGLALRKTERATVGNLKDEIIKVCGMLGIPVQYRTVGSKVLFPNGSEQILGACANADSYERHIGFQYSDIWWEEAVQHTKQAISLVNGSCRTDFEGCDPKYFYTTNPGGPGHQYLYDDFVNPKTRKERHVWVRSTLREALPTLVNDPGYLERIKRNLPEWKRRQWIDGDWEAMAGLYFEIDPDRNLKTDLRIPYWAEWFGGMDYGQAAPFVCLWAAKWQDENGVDHIHFVKEVYERGMQVNEQAELALEMEQTLNMKYNFGEKIRYYGDPSIGNPRPTASYEEDWSIRRIYTRAGWTVIPSSRIGRIAGWAAMRMLLKDAVLTIDPVGCPAFIKELRNAVYDDVESEKSEDVSQKCDDHALTAASYLLRKVFRGGYTSVPIDPYSTEAIVPSRLRVARRGGLPKEPETLQRVVTPVRRRFRED